MPLYETSEEEEEDPENPLPKRRKLSPNCKQNNRVNF